VGRVEVRELGRVEVREVGRVEGRMEFPGIHRIR